MATEKLASADFETKVLESDIPVLIDFWAEWCGPCKMIGPVLEEFSDEHMNSYKIYKVNVDEDNQLANQFDVRNIPTLMVFENGELKTRVAGFKTKEEILELFE